ncbi:MAG TPA: SDR family oxidoreductase [Bdellovibrionota bacterium]|jgi:NAD(P)-dependent dehydrogenase (short-subunit alcohol dehydrogenase family)
MKAVIVTGASSGIGKAAALRLASRGYEAWAGVRSAKDSAFWESVPHASPLLLDVTQETSVQSAMDRLRPLLKDAQEVHLVNNAGIAVAGPVEGVSIQRWREQFEVNVFGLVRITQALLPFIRATRGRIVNVSSVSGLATSPYMGPYSASKFAVEAISDALRRELRQFGCKVIVVEPGPIATPIWEKNLERKEKLLADLSEEIKNIYRHELELFQKGVKHTARNAAPVERASGAIEKALLLRNPRTRYVVGRKTLNAEMAFASFLPDSWVDSLVARQFR